MGKKKLYIIFTSGDIHYVGGMQMYIAGISKYLTQKGFEVAVFSPGDTRERCEIPELEKYVMGCNDLFEYEPSSFLPSELNKLFFNSISRMEASPDEYDSIYIESHADVDALWAEYFAKRLKGKHIALMLNELYDADYKLYRGYIEYFWHMYTEERLRGGLLTSLFKSEGYEVKDVLDGWAIEKPPIENVEDVRVASLKRATWNIAYIGRGDKEYVPTVISEMGKFARAHNDIDINFIFIGDSTYHYKLIKSEFADLANLLFSPIGNLIPIPKMLFDKVDVVIANSQTAFYCAHERIPVVSISTDDYLSSGILGYNCRINGDPNFREDFCESVCEALEDALINKKYRSNSFSIPPVADIDKEYEKALIAFEELKPSCQYFNVEEYFPKSGTTKRRNLGEIRNEINNWRFDIDSLIRSKVAIFGGGYEGRGCIDWLKNRGIDPVVIFDNDEAKKGTTIGGYIVESSHDIKNFSIDYYIICSRNHSEDIMNQLATVFGVERSKCTTFLYLKTCDVLEDDELMIKSKG